MRILVVDDEPDLCEILCFNLSNEGVESECAYSAEAALEMIHSGRRFDLILLDVMMEQMSGYDMARQLRNEGNDIPVIFLTALASEENQLDGFDSGGDDYIVKPFSFPTVMARIKAVLKRSASDSLKLECGGLKVDPALKRVSIDGKPVELTKKEFKILLLLMSNAGTHFSREQVLERVWEEDTCVGDRSVDVHIARLRKKLGPYSDHVVNHTGFGYVFVHAL